MLRKVYIRSIVRLGAEDPDVRPLLTPIEARRMGRLLKRALWTSVEALRQAGIDKPDAIITATDYGCLESSIAFLNALCSKGELPMRPVHFMQSTHNTIGSFIGIRLQCHGYNTTYSHHGNSFDSALMDAWMQIALGDIDTALVGWYDENIPLFSEMLSAKSVEPEEVALAFVLSASPEGALHELTYPIHHCDYV